MITHVSKSVARSAACSVMLSKPVVSSSHQLLPPYISTIKLVDDVSVCWRVCVLLLLHAAAVLSVSSRTRIDYRLYQTYPLHAPLYIPLCSRILMIKIKNNFLQSCCLTSAPHGMRTYLSLLSTAACSVLLIPHPILDLLTPHARCSTNFKLQLFSAVHLK